MTIEEKIAEIIEESQNIELAEATVNEEVEAAESLKSEDVKDLSISMQEDIESLDEAVKIEKRNYSWGKMITIHDGIHTSYPLHPEHQEMIKKLKPGEKIGFTDETKNKINAHRDDDHVILTSRGTNRKTIVPHSLFTESAKDLSISMQEDIAALTAGEELTEEFKEKAATIFEAAVLNRVKQEVSKLDEAYEIKLAEEVESIKEGLVEKIDGYLGYIAEQWMIQNEIALESGMKSEILEGFVSGLKSLFEEHYIDVPEEKFDVIGALSEEVDELKAKLDEQFESNVELNKTLIGYQAKQIIDELSEDLSLTDKEKFNSLVEELEVDGIESFKKKAQTIRESYFTNKVASRSVVGSVVTDESVILSEGKEIPAHMKGYLSVLDNLK